MKKQKNLAYTFLKLVITIVFLYFVFSKISFYETIEILRKSNLSFLLIGLLSFIISQWISANRLLEIFKSISFYLSPKSNYQLYLVGMFYNFFIPGGIGGDAYKVYLLQKKLQWSVKKVTSCILFDRCIGLGGLLILIVIISVFTPVFKSSSFLLKGLTIGCLPLMISAGYLLTYYLFPSFKSYYTKTLLFSVFVQLFQCLSIYFIAKSMSIPDNYIHYILIFLVSSILSVFSFSGIGVRELIFYQASVILSLDTAKSVSIGTLFSILTAFISIFGCFYIFRKDTSIHIKEKPQSGIPL
ncbi:lysylphosphatidylglycerol synthase transmembrane domain-containing protein [Aquimarina hainanensis]|uniref:Lysylphosphatidylglycerol synthase transmembrane domain-containing protein n=1 Tax=Aquimarina hainanensis TaxID=1578017 RepID=A0ABW5N435_9FLAO|nr:lysylphosphatidylglycerol synthase transmembrane domain-containing protein [Aquimarina sp. TRL1]QKX04518.1 flippase-like domain-containing protein [Aquimarina sp. TRL1]